MLRTDEEGYFYVMDRKKDMFISGRMCICGVIQHPASLLMCAVIGPDAKWEKLVKRKVLKPDDLPTERSIEDGESAKYKVQVCNVLESLPISAAGKILKRELRDQFLKQGA
jgi:fatty-acyl-CoA synthase